MNNHFGKGLMAGLNAAQADAAASVGQFCADYKRGFVLGFSQRMFEQTGDRQLSAWEAGVLTRRYDLDKEMVMDFFRDANSQTSVRYFMAGYRIGR
ncbi:DUF2623 family protein [Enterobacteriaceae bacterium RIT691]|nr:DUF2623 family protein [Enterobacteriaceae bacterium RIT691]